ncbi:MASE1 domain-containing protein [Bradyrhizobium manausense]|uniref:sensor histidine kinase n=1 Tax=Bradyrhizobium TaxID=374 RepID=UPI001BA9BAC1|nr:MULTISPECIES: ATP-binding protein [Bradyrhizobium]MBR0831379.1 MASE1 domain-containing protein [Bradyrhizobium manausense]UVO27773.1 MASE1 domain-containing protein [Bradyrhizobium arachidis]
MALIYFVTARLSLALLDPADGVAVFWPAGGVASGILIALGPAAQLPVVLGVAAATIAANLLGDRNIWSSLFFAVTNTSETVIVAGLIHRFCGSPFELNELRRVLALFAATGIATSISGLGGTAVFVLFHGSAASPAVIWFHWFSSASIGIIAVTPLAIGLASLARTPPPRWEVAEGVLALGVVSLVCALLAFLPNEPWTAVLAVGVLCPLLLWISARLRPAFTAIATFFCSTTIVWTTTFAIGIFGDPRLSIEERVLTAQATILAITLGALVLAALFSERRLHHDAILERESRLQDAWKSAQLADRAKSSFLAAASHDLRQPLQTLKLLQAALESHHSSGEARNLVAEIGKSLDTMTSILSSLLDVNKLESGNLRPSVSEFSLSEIFEPLARDFVASVQERGLRLCIVRSELIIRSDSRMLAEMIRNLLSNAVRYTDRGRILLGCRRVGDNVRIEVWDSGVGITEDQLPHIFDEYYQGTDGAKLGGFGLGLAIVKRLGEILDHRVEVRSIPGKGTRFFIEVPRGRSGVNVPEAASPVHLYNGAFLGSVLAIEDEASVRSALRRLLKERGVDATIVATETEALTLVKEQSLRPDVLLCDYNLRGSSDGIETVRRLRVALGRNVPTVMMTGDIRSQTMDLISAQGITVLIKPFQAEELLDALRGREKPVITESASPH